MIHPVRRSARLAAAALLIVLCAALGSSHGSPVRGLRVERPVAARRRPRYAADRVLVRFRPGISGAYADGLLRSYGFPVVHGIPAIGVYSVQTASGVSVPETLAMLRRNGDIELARPDYRARLADIPNDTYFGGYQYALRNRGGVLNISPEIQPQMTAGADIKATDAWDAGQGDAETIIAIVDTGVDPAHPDLVSKLVSSGRDFANDDNEATDDHWHGTHVAGVAAADTNNGIGTAGVAWNCRILPVKVTDDSGNGYYSWIIDGIIWAADQGADVINVSLGGDVDDPFLEDACRYAHDRGVVVVAAAGNDGLAGVLYPAAYDDYVLAVAASDYNDSVAGFSNSGPEIDVAAPGVWILGPAPEWYVGPGYLPYLFASGTSAASPHVAGMAALIKSAKPGLPADDIMKIIRYTADDINRASDPGRDDRAGYGRINLARALLPYILD
jgi:thermitase